MVLLLLRLSFSFLLLVARFPAVGELRQELADPFDVSVGPDVSFRFASCDSRWSGDFASLDVLAESGSGYSKLFSRLTAGACVHSLSMINDS
jgi:hypothetical protein